MKACNGEKTTPKPPVGGQMEVSLKPEGVAVGLVPKRGGGLLQQSDSTY